VLPPAISLPVPTEEQTFTAEHATGLGNKKKHAPPKSADQVRRDERLEKDARFHQYVGQVLRFTCFVQQDSSSKTQARRDTTQLLSLMYYLADGTVEINADKSTRRNGRQPMGRFLNRGLLPKNWQEMQRRAPPVYYTETDFRVRSTVSVYGKELLLIDCDQFTREYYRETYSIDQEKVEIPKDGVLEVTQNIPKRGDGFLAIGSEEATLATVFGQRVPAKNFKKMQRDKGRMLRCRLHMVTSHPVNSTRKFVLTYYLEDDSIQVFEETVKNSGVVGGTFLKQGRHQNIEPSDGGAPRVFKPTDIYVGNTVGLHGGGKMLIVEMDSASIHFCESHPEEFPLFDVHRICATIAERCIERRLSLRSIFKPHDLTNSGLLDNPQILLQLLQSCSVIPELSHQEQLVLLRRYSDQPTSAQVSYADFCDTVVQAALARQGTSHAVRTLLRSGQWR
jgi:hypothetical protein